MTSKTIDNIVWWIPFRKLRDDVRDYLYSIYNGVFTPIQVLDTGLIINFRENIKNESDFFLNIKI